MNEILSQLKQHGKAMEIYDIAEAVGAPVDEVYRALAEEIRQGRVVLTKKEKYALPADVGLIPARMVVTRSGAPIARPLDGGDDLPIEERGAFRPMADDLLLVKRVAGHGRGGNACKLVAITHRAHERFMAILQMKSVRAEPRGRKADKKKGRPKRRTPDSPTYAAQLQPLDARLSSKIELQGTLQGARHGDMVQLRVTSFPERGAAIRVVIERVLGEADDLRVQLRAIALQHGISETFPEEVLQSAALLPARELAGDLSERRDLRNLCTFTIDGDDAQDFDDAVSLEVAGDGWRLGVHIADVSHYVRPHTPIDREALERGTSVYLPGYTIPMLPEALCNDLCSLMPGVDRLAMSLFMEIRGGKIVDHELTPSVIHSRARLTYREVNNMLSGLASNVPEDLFAILRAMDDLAGQLRQRRHARGSIDFDLPETAFTLNDQGQPIDVRARSRGPSERLIEDFMLAANETIAELARTTELPLLYRVHDRPTVDRIRSLELFLSGLSIPARLGNEPAPSQFQQILSGTENREDAALIKQVMLRSLRRAEYSGEPKGHFGLAAKDYCHFTSPIRRYPDLIVHRMLRQLLSGNGPRGDTDASRMEALAKQCSASEQRATLAERDADDLVKAHYMAGHIGQAYSGVVSGVTAWGFYVTLTNTVEGLVPMRTLSGYYEYDPDHHCLRRSDGDVIYLGDPVTILFDRVDLQSRQIDFTLHAHNATKSANRAPSGTPKG